MYDETIPENATRKVVKLREMTHKGWQSERVLYEAGDKDILAFIMEFLDSRRYATFEHPGNFFANVTALEILTYLGDFCTGLHVIDVLEYPMAMKAFWKKAEGVPQYIVRMEALQKNPSRSLSQSRMNLCRL